MCASYKMKVYGNLAKKDKNNKETLEKIKQNIKTY
jgi:hypothetical protein